MSRGTVRRLYRLVSATLGELRGRNRVLYTVAVGHVALALLFTVLMAVDTRTLLGRNVWTKPWKFATSIAIFTATIGWLLPSLSLTDRVERLVTSVIGVAMTVEITLISAQAARGVASHFNTSTPLDTGIFLIMGVTITISSVAVAYVLWRVVRDPPSLAPAYRAGIALGMFLFVAASFEGWLMVLRQSHSVGAPSGGPGLPLLNWSVTGGDLRIAHFVGLHALQVLPLTGYLASRWDHLSTAGAVAVVATVGVGYSAFVAATFALAMLGLPIVATVRLNWVPPSAVAAFLLAATVLGGAAVATLWKRPTPE